jgi:transposase InsO family protein
VWWFLHEVVSRNHEGSGLNDLVDLTPAGGQTRVSDGNANERGSYPAGSNTELPARIQTRSRPPCSVLAKHTDRAGRYTTLSFGKRVEDAGIVPSMGQTGSVLDNAISEAFVASLKCELLHRHRFVSREAARTAVFEYVEGFYNRVRRHSSLDYLSPSEYEGATMEAMKEVALA